MKSPTTAPENVKALRALGGQKVERARAELKRLEARRTKLGHLLTRFGFTGGGPEEARLQREVREVAHEISQVKSQIDELLYGTRKGRTEPGPSVVRSVVSGGLPTLGRGR